MVAFVSTWPPLRTTSALSRSSCPAPGAEAGLADGWSLTGHARGGSETHWQPRVPVVSEDREQAGWMAEPPRLTVLGAVAASRTVVDGRYLLDAAAWRAARWAVPRFWHPGRG
jgi:hypothetical protein